MDDILDNDEELEEQAQAEIDKVLYEVTAGTYDSSLPRTRGWLRYELPPLKPRDFQAPSGTLRLRKAETSRSQAHRRSTKKWRRCENDYKPSKVESLRRSFTNWLVCDVQ